MRQRRFTQMETENMSEAEMIDSEGPLYNELNDGRVSIDARLTPGIDPSQWAETCRVLGAMDAGLFSCVQERIHAISKNYQQGLQEVL